MTESHDYRPTLTNRIKYCFNKLIGKEYKSKLFEKAMDMDKFELLLADLVGDKKISLDKFSPEERQAIFCGIYQQLDRCARIDEGFIEIKYNDDWSSVTIDLRCYYISFSKHSMNINFFRFIALIFDDFLFYNFSKEMLISMSTDS